MVFRAKIRVIPFYDVIAGANHMALPLRLESVTKHNQGINISDATIPDSPQSFYDKRVGTKSQFCQKHSKQIVGANGK
jgi:hypothetical protein